MIYYTLRKILTKNPHINLKNEVGSATLLGSTAFCSGFIWQPCVNMFSSLGFVGCAIGTGTVCAITFFLAIRVFRLIYSKIFESVGENNYINLKKDAQLSIAIGGAAACFVATDPLLPGKIYFSIIGNFLKVPFGVTPDMSPLTAMVTAGSSTAGIYLL
jgi:hypothetical protein